MSGDKGDGEASDIEVVQLPIPVGANSPEALRHDLEVVLVANLQLVERLKLAARLNQELANTLAALVETHGIVMEERGGRTLRVSARNVQPLIEGGQLRVHTDEATGFTYYTMVYGVLGESDESAELNRPGSVVRKGH